MDLEWIVCLYQDVNNVTDVRKLIDERMNGWEELEVRQKERRSLGALLEAQKVQDGSYLREMISEMRGRCMVCFFGGRSENDKHELQRCRYDS